MDMRDSARLALVLLTALLLPAWAMAQSAETVSQVSDAVVTVLAGERSGAGFIVNSQGDVVTNDHVVGKATGIVVKLRTGEKLAAQMGQADSDRDLCLLKVERTHLPTVKFGPSAKLRQGEDVAAIGAPFGFENSLSKGAVGSAQREIDGRQYIQIDAALNPGNSGGPVINADGLVVGMATKTAKEGQNLGFAVPSDQVMAFLDQAQVDYQTALAGQPTGSGATAPDAATSEAPAATPAEPPAPAAPESAPEPAPAPTVQPAMIWVVAALISVVASVITVLLLAPRLTGRAAEIADASAPAIPQPGYMPPPPASQSPARPAPAAPPPDEDLSDIDIELR